MKTGVFVLILLNLHYPLFACCNVFQDAETKHMEEIEKAEKDKLELQDKLEEMIKQEAALTAKVINQANSLIVRSSCKITHLPEGRQTIITLYHLVCLISQNMVIFHLYKLKKSFFSTEFLLLLGGTVNLTSFPGLHISTNIILCE